MSHKAEAVPLRSSEIEPAVGGSIPIPAKESTRRSYFDSLITELRPDLCRYAFWLGRDRALAEDVVQEALLRAWRSIGSLRDEQSAKQWLLTIVRREHARVYQRKRLETTDVDALIGAEEQLIATTDDTDVREMRQAIFQLEADYREPLVLQVMMGYKTEEIAEIMGISLANVLTRLFRARRKLKAELGWGTEE